MPPPPESIIFGMALYLAGPFVWGYLCSRLRTRLLGILLVFLPYLILGLIWRDLFNLSIPPVLDFFATYVASALIGYALGLLITRRRKKKTLNQALTTHPNP